MTTLCSAIFPCSALHAILDSLHLALVPTELKAVIQTQLPQKTSVHWASKRAASPLTFRSYKAVWQYLLPRVMSAGAGSDGKGILHVEEFISMRIHVCWQIRVPALQLTELLRIKALFLNVAPPAEVWWFFSLIFIEWEVSTFCWLTISAEARPPPLLRNSADSLERGQRTVQVQEEAKGQPGLGQRS